MHIHSDCSTSGILIAHFVFLLVAFSLRCLIVDPFSLLSLLFIIFIDILTSVFLKKFSFSCCKYTFGSCIYSVLIIFFVPMKQKNTLLRRLFSSHTDHERVSETPGPVEASGKGSTDADSKTYAPQLKKLPDSKAGKTSRSHYFSNSISKSKSFSFEHSKNSICANDETGTKSKHFSPKVKSTNKEDDFKSRVCAKGVQSL